MEDIKEILDKCNRFLKKSDSRYSTTINRAVNDLRLYSGNFWSSDLIKDYRRKSRINLSLNNWNPIVNAISSPISNSPWHIELTEDNYNEIQDAIDNIEHDNDSKSALVESFRKTVLCGYGFLVISTVEDELTMEPKIIVESVNRLDSVAIDPNCNTPDCSDAEEGAVINYIGIDKARRLYGNDVVPMTYPRTECFIAFSNFTQWNIPQESVAVISYYTKVDNGVMLYKIVGNKVVEEILLPIKYIPIIRLAGNEVLEDNDINYNGIVQQTYELELGANIAYSTLIERCGRSPKANYLVHVDAIDGLERNMAAVAKDDTVAVLWKGEHQPVPLTESFQTGDLQNTINTCRTLIEDTLGVPLTGIQGERERTATEILRQEISKESNTANYYNNAYKAMRTIGRIIIELLNEGNDLKFKLENGPAVITRQMKVRNELNALSTIMPDNMKPILAKYFSDTLKNDLGDELSKNIVANLPNELKLIDEAIDPVAIHQLNQMQAQMEETMAELEKMKEENDQLRQQLNTTQINLLENRESRELEWQKFNITEQNKMQIELAKLQQQGVKIDTDAYIKQEELAIKEAESEMNRQEEVNDAYIKGVTDTIGGI